jgi:hypothetical protein
VLLLADRGRSLYIGSAVNARLLLCVLALSSAACGVGVGPASQRSLSSAQALSGTAEWLEFESPAARAELYRDVLRSASLQQQASKPTSAILFPMLRDGVYVAAPAVPAGLDLLLAPDSGAPYQLVLDARTDRFSDDRRDSFQGLSEREAVEQIARSLLTHWGIPAGAQPIVVERAAQVPYAAAWMDGVLRINPAFVYMVTAPASP